MVDFLTFGQCPPNWTAINMLNHMYFSQKLHVGSIKFHN